MYYIVMLITLLYIYYIVMSVFAAIVGDIKWLLSLSGGLLSLSGVLLSLSGGFIYLAPLGQVYVAAHTVVICTDFVALSSAPLNIPRS